MVTRIPEATLVELRRWGLSQRGQFAETSVVRRCCEVLDRRGEAWAAAVLGRDLTRRSMAVPHRPFMHLGEEHTLVAADRAEDDLVVFEMERLL